MECHKGFERCSFCFPMCFLWSMVNCRYPLHIRSGWFEVRYSQIFPATFPATLTNVLLKLHGLLPTPDAHPNKSPCVPLQRTFMSMSRGDYGDWTCERRSAMHREKDDLFFWDTLRHFDTVEVCLAHQSMMSSLTVQALRLIFGGFCTQVGKGACYLYWLYYGLLPCPLSPSVIFIVSAKLLLRPQTLAPVLSAVHRYSY